LRAAILDEAQQVKNPDAAVTHAAVALRARQRVALTGTPLENRALDLWSIMSFVNPGYLGSRAGFTRRFDRLDGAPHGHTLLAALLEPLLAEGHKVLVFSQFVECLKLLAAELGARDVPYHMLTGETVKREVVVKAFTDDARACAFLVSLRAGGLGLNLTAASYVVLFDPWWNPAVEAQAIDRTHRIGQDRTVIAYRLLARGTIEEKIWELQPRQAVLVRDVLGEGGFG